MGENGIVVLFVIIIKDVSFSYYILNDYILFDNIVDDKNHDNFDYSNCSNSIVVVLHK